MSGGEYQRIGVGFVIALAMLLVVVLSLCVSMYIKQDRTRTETDLMLTKMNKLLAQSRAGNTEAGKRVLKSTHEEVSRTHYTQDMWLNGTELVLSIVSLATTIYWLVTDARKEEKMDQILALLKLN